MIASWTDDTLRKLGNRYIHMMIEAGLITLENNQKKVTPPILAIELENYLKENKEVNIIKALTGVN